MKKFLFTCGMILGLWTLGFSDLEISPPPGTPLEWTLKRPVETGQVGIPQKYDSKKDGTAISRPKPKPQPYGNFSMYNYLGVTTFDITQHIGVPKYPDGEKYVQKGKQIIDTGKNSGSDVEVVFMYPPPIPTEVYWESAAGVIRVYTHPETTSVWEVVARLTEIGEIAWKATKHVEFDPVAEQVQKRTSDVPAKVPTPPKNYSDPFKDSLMRLTVLELISGYPFSFDPNYCRKIFTFANLTEEMVYECAKSDHTFLSRNAVSALNAYQSEKTLKILRELLASKDEVKKIRAAMSLAAAKDKEAARTFTAWLQMNDNVYKSVAAYCLGAIGDDNAMVNLTGQLANWDADLLWSVIPALARIGSDKAIPHLKAAKEKILKQAPKNNAPPAPTEGLNKPRFPDPGGTKQEVLKDMCTLALASCGDKEAQGEVNRSMDKSAFEKFLIPTWYLLCDTLARMGDVGKKHLMAIAKGDLAPTISMDKGVTQAHVEMLRARAVTNLSRMPNPPQPEFFESLTNDPAMPSISVAALVALFNLSSKDFKDTALKLVQQYKNTEYATTAYILSQLLYLLGTMEGLTEEILLEVVKSAFEKDGYAKRTGNNDPDITKAQVSTYPALLETAVIELGKVAGEKGKTLLLNVLNSDKKGGRAEAALALSSIGGDDVVKALVERLLDKDSWVRFCCYMALKNITGKDLQFDYLFSSPEALAEFQKKWKKELGIN